MVKFKYSVRQRVFIYASYVRTESAREVRRLFQKEYPDVQVPNRSTVHKLVDKFRETGSVFDRKRRRARTVLTEETLDNIRHALDRSPRISFRRLSQQMGISYGSVQTAMKILKLESKMPALQRESFPASPRLIHEMEPDQHTSSAIEEITIKAEPVVTEDLAPPLQEFEHISVKQEPPEMEADQHKSSAIEEITIKVETVVTEDLVPPMQEFEHISVKQEPPVEFEAHESPKQEIEYISVKEEPPNVQKWEEPSANGSPEDPLSVDKGECSPPEVYLGPNTSNIDKTENEEDEEEEMSEGNEEDIQHELCSTHDDSEPESTIVDGVDNNDMNDTGSLAAKLEPSCENKSGIKPLVHRCTICNKTFEQLENLKNHKHIYSHEFLQIHMHTGEVHLRVHLGDKPHMCVICAKPFGTAGNLRRHMRVHTGDRPYSCAICNQTFTQTSALKQHSQLHTGQRPYSCDVCNKTFTYRNQLKRHSQKHSEERLYSCNVCHERFKCRPGLSGHYARVHSVDEALIRTLHTG